MTVYQPVCTCAVEGIYGCLMHPWNQVAKDMATHYAMTADEVAARIGDAMAGAVRDLEAVPEMVRTMGEAIRNHDITKGIAQVIAEGGAFTDADAVRVARAYLEERT